LKVYVFLQYTSEGIKIRHFNDVGDVR
jgi:hypothetical protein